MDSERLDDGIFDDYECVDGSDQDFLDNSIVVDGEVIDSDDDIGYDSENFVNRIFRGSKRFYALLAFINAVCISLCIYMNHFMYNPKERDLLNDNLFSGNSIVASKDEVDDIVASLEKELGVCIIEDEIDDYCLLHAVMENPNLTEEEKDFFYNYIDLIKDNPYLNKEEAYRSLLNVDIVYKCRPFGCDSSVQGLYAYEFESIGIFDEDKDRTILGHEAVHCIYCNETTVGLPMYFKEGMTELLTNEYFSSSPFLELANYPFEVAAIKMLCELTSSDTVLKAFSYGDMNIIVEDIASVTGDYDGIVNALDMLDYAMCKFNGTLTNNEVVLSDEEILSGFIPKFRECIELKYDKSSRNRISYFYNEILFANIFSDDPYDDYVDDLIEFGSDHKAYFSSKLKQQITSKEIIDKIGDDEVVAEPKELKK